MKRSWARRCAAACRRSAYSSAAPASWIEHGPTTATRRSSAPWSTRCTAWRALVTVASDAASIGSSSTSSCGARSARTAEIRKSSVLPAATAPGSWACVLSPVFTIFMSFLHGDPAAAYAVGQCLQQVFRVFPAEAGVGDGHAVLERLARHQVLPAGMDVAFDHHAGDAALPLRELPRDVGADVQLLLELLGRVRVREIDHQLLAQARARKLARCGVDARGVVVRLLSAAQDHVAVLVARGLEHGDVARLGDRDEMVARVGGLDRVHRDAHVAVGAVLETHRAGQARGELAMRLRLGGARADRAPRDEV